jgi:methylated-DNA-[protein]-cysteine S-methyltransferase
LIRLVPLAKPAHRMAEMKLAVPQIEAASHRASIDMFATAIGWFGVVSRGAVVTGIKFGFETESEVRSSFESEGLDAQPSDNPTGGWRDVIGAYADGNQVSFSDIEIDLAQLTPFQNQVVRGCRQIPYGSTMTYGELAAQVGSPGAARAVGTIMRTNRFPIIVPCHRVVGARGLGGYSASRGVQTKRRLLTMEHAIRDEIATLPSFD